MRQSLPDILKGIAVILMIQVHIMELFIRPDIYDSIVGKASLFLGGVPAAPLFMVIMGYFIALSDKSTAQLIRRGISLIGLGILLNLGLNLHLLIRIMSGEFQLNPWEYIFGVDILFLAGLSIIVIALLKTLICDAYYIFFILAIVIVFSHQSIPFDTGDGIEKYFIAFIYGESSWSYFPLLPWIAYPLTGYAFARFKSSIYYQSVHKLQIVLLIIGIAGFVAGLQYGYDISSKLNVYYHHDGIFFLWALSFLLMIVIGSHLLFRNSEEQSILRHLQWIGKNVTAFYVIQWLIIGNIATAVFRSQGIIVYLVAVFVVTIITFLLVKLYNNTFRINN